MSKRTPSICHHKASGQAVVRIDGKDYYLGTYGSAESQTEYDRLVAEWLGNGQRLVSSAPVTDQLSVNEIALVYWECAVSYYQWARGTVPASRTRSASSRNCTAARRRGHSARGLSKPAVSA